MPAIRSNQPAKSRTRRGLLGVYRVRTPIAAPLSATIGEGDMPASVLVSCSKHSGPYQDGSPGRKVAEASPFAKIGREALSATFQGRGVFVIANSDTVMSCPTSELLSEILPDVPLKKKLGPNESLLSIQKAKRGLRAAA
jgi:hypothetical protein